MSYGSDGDLTPSASLGPTPGPTCCCGHWPHCHGPRSKPTIKSEAPGSTQPCSPFTNGNTEAPGGCQGHTRCPRRYAAAPDSVLRLLAPGQWGGGEEGREAGGLNSPLPGLSALNCQVPLRGVRALLQSRWWLGWKGPPQPRTLASLSVVICQNKGQELGVSEDPQELLPGNGWGWGGGRRLQETRQGGPPGLNRVPCLQIKTPESSPPSPSEHGCI